MKRIIAASTAALVLVSGAASAMNSANDAAVLKFAPEADLAGYSDAAIAHIVNTINDDRDDSFVQKQAQVRSLLKHLN
ncbi:hypothetical protein Q4544_13115 [Cognatishimia sp. 1_MG-2023]|uniref:hypothetical protein n=1 Tax=Cognatishimia sp. 1_MG-2023 TaxID=3062642 RepID=UPI0026E40E0F|nr:hypothetical protein [Cognatishimia sp. 1_MG-2023]MDO6727874.1 hypothetical protein [Cognatishimia sp. 1_MG-2023]